MKCVGGSSCNETWSWKSQKERKKYRLLVQTSFFGSSMQPVVSPPRGTSKSWNMTQATCYSVVSTFYHHQTFHTTTNNIVLLLCQRGFTLPKKYMVLLIMRGLKRRTSSFWYLDRPCGQFSMFCYVPVMASDIDQSQKMCVHIPRYYTHRVLLWAKRKWEKRVLYCVLTGPFSNK